jgi:hypothetical protein
LSSNVSHFFLENFMQIFVLKSFPYIFQNIFLKFLSNLLPNCFFRIFFYFVENFHSGCLVTFAFMCALARVWSRATRHAPRGTCTWVEPLVRNRPHGRPGADVCKLDIPVMLHAVSSPQALAIPCFQF